MPRGRKKQKLAVEQPVEEKPDIDCDNCWRRYSEKCRYALSGSRCTRWSDGESEEKKNADNGD